jgi:hypothetical protein
MLAARSQISCALTLLLSTISACESQSSHTPGRQALKVPWTAFAVGMVAGDDANAPEPFTRKLWVELEAQGLAPVRITYQNSDDLVGTRQPPLVRPYVTIKSIRPGRPGCISSLVSSRGPPALSDLEINTRLSGFPTPSDDDRCIEEHVKNIKTRMMEAGY